MSTNEVWCVNDAETCVVCFKTAEYYSIGICDHPVCFECSTRMRVLCRQNECPICRQDMPKVVFCTEISLFRRLKARLEHTPFVDNKFGIWFETSEIQKAYNHLLEYTCTKCSKPEHFQTFLQLKEHYRKLHELHYCDLCVEHLRIFPWERKCYTRSELAQHRRKGDLDDTSHRGHPICEFCDTRYMDGDDLFRHLRREHLFCHFCDADGKHQYYSSYEFLRQHFQIEHYLCEEGECINEKFTSVFRSDIDMKAHRAQMHGKQLGKVATKQARTLELEFTLRPRSGPKMPAHLLGGAPPNSSSRNEAYVPGMDMPPLIPVLDITGEDFPSLDGSFTSTSLPPRPISSAGNLTVRHITQGQKGLARTNKNFPALSSDSSTVRLSVNSSTVGPQESLQTTTTTNAQNVSILVNHRTNGAITTHISQNQPNAVRMRPRTDAFPALGAVTVQEPQWVKLGPFKEQKPKATKVASAPVLPNRNLQMDFPELSMGKLENKPKKTSSLTMPVSSSWVTEQSEHREQKNNKGKKKKSKHTVTNRTNSPSNTASELNVNQSNKTTSASDNKPNASKKKETQPRSQVQTRPDIQTRSQIEKQVPSNKQNGVIKKRSELKIDSLHIAEARVNDGDRNDFPPLSASNAPPGIAVQAPPGFAANDLTFTNSSGQSYSILPPTHFTAPLNFPQRNQKLIESFMTSSTNDDIMEFKTLSSLFRSGVYSAEEYYRSCKSIMKDNFARVFPELLVLLPDIDKQQELYAIHTKETGSKRGLEVCATCGQVVSTGDLRSHLASHRMDNHFPALGAQEIPSVWKKP
ncbi:uncharacterized protein CBL_13457 [Carabus blaptoides fortunei]